MDDPSPPTRDFGWAFLFALRRESAPFTRRLRLLCTFPDAPCPAALFNAGGQIVVVLETGVGCERAGRAATWLLNSIPPRLVVAAGFAGALSRTLKVGDVLLASGV